MYFMDELPYMRLFSNKRKVYAPINPSDKKKGAAVMLLTKSPVESTTLMNLPYIHNPNLYHSLYIDRNVSALVNSGMIEDIDESINEAMVHKVEDKKFKINVVCHTASTNDLKLTKDVFKAKNFEKWYYFFKTNTNRVPKDITVYVYPSVKDMAKAANKDAISNGEFVLNSYSTSDSIHVVAFSGFSTISSAEGKNYTNYLTNELITHICMNSSKRCSRYLACQIATALSGQLDAKLADKLENDWGNVKDDSIATALIIKNMYDAEGPRSIIKLCKTGDYNDLIKFSSKSFVKRISGVYEAALTAADRKNLKDSDYGLPKDKKYPMPDESHVRSAIRFFNHVDIDNEKELAENIKKKINQYGMTLNVSDDNRFSKYYNENNLIYLESTGNYENSDEVLKVIISEDKIDNEAKKVSKQRQGLAFFNFMKTFRNLSKDSKALAKRPKMKNSWDYESLRPWLLGMVESADTEERIKYLRTDAYTGINQLTKLAKNVRDVQNGTPSRYVAVDHVQKMIDNGCTPEVIEDHVKWLKTVYLPAINKRAKEIRKAKNESTLLEVADISKDKIVVGTDFHFVGYDDSKTKIIIKPKSYIEGIIKKQNELTGNDGIFIFLGDILYKSFRDEYDIPQEMKKEAINYIKQFKGKYKILVRGNHDKLPDEFYLNCGFTHICSSLLYENILFTHQPEIVKPPMINVHGHIHGMRQYAESKPTRYIDVWTMNKQHLDTLANIIDAQEEYEKTIKQSPSVDKVDPHQFITGERLELNDILKESTILESHNLTAKETPRENPNDPVSSKGVKLTFFDNGNKIGEASISSIDTDNGFLYDVEVFKPYRGKGYGNAIMDYVLKHYKINELTVEEGNTIALNLYKKYGFKEGKKFKEDGKNMIDMKIHESVMIPLPVKLLKESSDEEYIFNEDYIATDNFITFFNGMDNQVISEAEKKYDAKLKKYLFTQRMKNNKTVLLRYQEMKVMSPWIKKTFLKLSMYRRFNLFIDLSYYHGLFLEKLDYKKDMAIKMYWDFVNRLIVDSEYKEYYNKITVFIPVYPTAWDVTDAENLMDYRKSINPISMIIRMLRTNPDKLKAWGNKDIVFLSPKGYFKVNFQNFHIKDLAKFKRFITMLVSEQEIADSDEDGYGNTQTDSDSPAVITAKITDKIEKNMGVQIDDITGGQTADKPTNIANVLSDDAPKFDHLRIRTHKIEVPVSSADKIVKNEDIKSTIFVMAPDSDAVIDAIKTCNIDKSMWLSKGYYKP